MFSFLKKIFCKRNLKEKGIDYVKKHFGEEYIDEFVEKYDKINMGIPIVFEDLNKFTGKFKFKNKEFSLNYRRLMSILHIMDIKNIVQRISKNYGITISLTNSEYTSQECSHCHHISKNNRKTQEHFHCEKCGYTSNADLNAAINIKNRLSSNVLKESFHNEIEMNQFIPSLKYHNDFKHSYMLLNHILYS